MVHIPAQRIPLSSYMSEAAKQAFIKRPFAAFDSFNSNLSMDIKRELVDNWARPWVERAKSVHPVSIQEQKMADVRTDIIEPKEGVSPRNRDRVLISLHGGGYEYFSGGLARLIEAIPVAGYGKIKVVSVDYRLYPTDKFPAAVEDVVAVYRSLLSKYKPENVGIYGCSTGATLTANVIVWLQREKLPHPGAIGLFCQGAVKDDQVEGDALYFGSAMMGGPIVAPDEPHPPEAYLRGTDPDDPLVAPVVSLEALSQFPPTLLLSGTRDFCLSTVLYTHSRLIKAGAQAELHVWDGMWHAFYFNVDLPESKEAYDMINKFFDKYLGQRIIKTAQDGQRSPNHRQSRG